MGQGLRSKIGQLTVLTTLGARLDLRTQPCAGAIGDCLVEIRINENLKINIQQHRVRLPSKCDPKLPSKQPSSQ